jgi:hypothetical protein
VKILVLEIKELKSLLLMLSVIFLLNGACTSEPEINKNKFDKLSGAARSVKTSIAAGESYQQVADRIQQLSIELTALRNAGTAKREKNLLDAYSDLLAIYRDGLLLWKYKLEFAFFDSVLKGRIYVGQDVEPIVLKYRLSMESHLYEPTGLYWKSIPGDSIRIIWSNADSQMKIIEHITNY